MATRVHAQKHPPGREKGGNSLPTSKIIHEKLVRATANPLKRVPHQPCPGAGGQSTSLSIPLAKRLLILYLKIGPFLAMSVLKHQFEHLLYFGGCSSLEEKPSCMESPSHWPSHYCFHIPLLLSYPTAAFLPHCCFPTASPTPLVQLPLQHKPQQRFLIPL